MRNLTFAELNRVENEVAGTIKYYAGVAAGIGASPIPCSDAVLLSGLQVKMVKDIFGKFGIVANFVDYAAEIISTRVATLVGKTIAGSLLKWIPGVGTIIGGAVNAGVASSVTYTMGRATVKAARIIVENGWQDERCKIVTVLRQCL